MELEQTTTTRITTMEPLAPPFGHALARVVKQVAGSNSTGKVSYGTEGGFFENAGIPKIICGPV